MFIWDYVALFAVWIFVVLSLVIFIWVNYTLGRSKSLENFKDADHFYQCLYCGHNYMHYFVQNECRCPRCLSYHN